MSKKINLIVICAVVLRLFLASFFYHPDLRVYYFHGQFLSRGVWDIYRYLEKNRFSLPNSNTFNYPPLAYLFYGINYSLAHLVAGPSLDAWINDWSGHDLYHPQLYFFLLLLKSPYFLIDALCLYVLLSLVSNHKSKSQLTLLWLFNPITLYGTYMVGQFDLLPVLLTLMALKAVKENKINKSVVFLVIGGFLKSYPLLLLPFVLIRHTNIKKLFFSICLVMTIWLVPQLPFITSQGYSDSVLNSGLANRIFSSETSFVPFVAFYLVIFFVSLERRSRLDLTFEFFAVTLGVILFSAFHAQWLMWALPFGFLFLEKSSKLLFPFSLVILSAMSLIMFLPDKFVFIAQFSALNPYLTTIPPLAEILKSAFPDLLMKLENISRTVLVTSGLWFVYDINKK